MALLTALAAGAFAFAAPSDVEAQGVPLVLGGDLWTDEALRDELSLRLPERPVVRLGPGDAPPPEFLWVTAESPEPDAIVVQIITSDGRLYERRVSLPAVGDPARVAAGVLANLVDGIESRTITPDRIEVEVPLEELEPEPEPEPEPAPEPAPEPEPEPEPEQQPGPAPEPAAHIHVSLGGALVVGIGPPQTLAGLVGAGGVLGVRWVGPRGLSLGGQVRGVGWGEAGVDLGRVRLWAQAGYVWTARRWAVRAVGGPTVEPLVLGTIVREPEGGRRAPVPLIGLAAAAGPRWRAWGGPQGPSGWVTVDLEVSGSAEARADMGVLLVRDASSDAPLLRAGGLEVTPTLGLEVRL